MIGQIDFCATVFATPNKKAPDYQGLVLMRADRTGLKFNYESRTLNDRYYFFL
jgi:hypothetical protein